MSAAAAARRRFARSGRAARGSLPGRCRRRGQAGGGATPGDVRSGVARSPRPLLRPPLQRHRLERRQGPLPPAGGRSEVGSGGLRAPALDGRRASRRPYKSLHAAQVRRTERNVSGYRSHSLRVEGQRSYSTSGRKSPARSRSSPAPGHCRRRRYDRRRAGREGPRLDFLADGPLRPRHLGDAGTAGATFTEAVQARRQRIRSRAASPGTRHRHRFESESCLGHLK